MSKTVLLIAVLYYLSRAEGFTFYIARKLTSTEQLPKDVWSSVEIDSTTSGDMRVVVSIPLALSYSDVFVFFANDPKEILRLHLNDTVNGNFYEMPHKLVKEIRGGETSAAEKETFHEIRGDFPKVWLPKDYNKVSATVLATDGTYYNYYGLQNSAISIVDLMVLEEFKKLSPD